MPHPPLRRCQLFLFKLKVWSFDSLPPPERVIQPAPGHRLAEACSRQLKLVSPPFVTVHGSACFASASVCAHHSMFPKRGQIIMERSIHPNNILQYMHLRHNPQCFSFRIPCITFSFLFLAFPFFFAFPFPFPFFVFSLIFSTISSSHRHLWFQHTM